MDCGAANQRVITLSFHGLGNPNRRELEPGEDELWMAKSDFLTILDAVPSTGEVEITFDDGNDSDVLVALPALVERGLRAQFFIIADRIGARGSVGADDLRELVEAGMQIGSHGMRHIPWRRLSGGDMTAEFLEARDVIEACCGQQVSAVACPFGMYDRSTIRPELVQTA